MRGLAVSLSPRGVFDSASENDPAAWKTEERGGGAASARDWKPAGSGTARIERRDDVVRVAYLRDVYIAPALVITSDRPFH